MLIKNLGRIAVVVAALPAIFVGAKFAKEDAQKEINQANMGQVKEAEWVRVDGNGNIIPLRRSRHYAQGGQP